MPAKHGEIAKEVKYDLFKRAKTDVTLLGKIKLDAYEDAWGEEEIEELGARLEREQESEAPPA